MKDISVKHSSKTETIDFGPVGRDILLDKKIEKETVRATNREEELAAAVAELGVSVVDVKVDGESVVDDDKIAQIDLTSLEQAIEQNAEDIDAAEVEINNLWTKTEDIQTEFRAKDAELDNRIDNVERRGRYLALWNAVTGLPISNPSTTTYEYKPGDYYIVKIVAEEGGTNYRPDGSQYVVGQASTTVETDKVNPDNTYYYDGTEWSLQAGGASVIPWGEITGDIADQEDLSTALAAKANDSAVIHTTGQESVNGYKMFVDGLRCDDKIDIGTASGTGSIQYNSMSKYFTFNVGTSPIIRMTTTALRPNSSSTPIDLGTSAYTFKKLYLNEEVVTPTGSGTDGQVLMSGGADQAMYWGDAPAPSNMVTTDTEQAISGAKTFSTSPTIEGTTTSYPTLTFKTATGGSTYNNNFGISNLDSSGKATFTLDGNFIPSTHNTYTLGASDVRWSRLYVNDITFSGNILPVNSLESSLGSGTYRLNYIFTRDAYIYRNITDGENSVTVSKIVTSNTAQTISATKTFTVAPYVSELRVGSASGYSSLLYNSAYHYLTLTVPSTSDYHGSIYVDAEYIMPASTSKPVDLGMNINGYRFNNLHLAKSIVTPTGSGNAGQVLISGGSDTAMTWGDAPAPTNMVTTDTEQTISGQKTFTNSLIIIGDATNLPTLTFQYKDGGTTYDSALKVSSVSSSSSVTTFSLSGNLNPLSNNKYTLGSSNLRWSSIYSQNLYVYGNINLGAYNDQKYIGTSSYKFKTIYVSNLNDHTYEVPVANIVAKSTETEQTVTGQLKICVVTALPTNPDANTLYFIKES